MSLLSPQYFFYLASFRQFVHQFVQVPDLLSQRCLNFFNSIATNGAGDQARVRVERGLGKELFKRRVISSQSLQIFHIETGQP